MIPSGAQHLMALRQQGLTVPACVVRLDSDEKLTVPVWWLKRGYSAKDWWTFAPDVLVGKAQSIFRLDLRAFAGMTVTVVQHGDNDERMNQLINRLFVCGAETVLAVCDSVMVVTDGGNQIAA